MQIKETPKSLRAYFGIIAVIYLIAGSAVLLRSGLSQPIADVGLIIDVIFGFLYAKIAIEFDLLLTSRPTFIRGVLTANFASSILGFAIEFIWTRNGPVFGFLVGAIIYFYLLTQIGNLSGESYSTPNQSKDPTP